MATSAPLLGPGETGFRLDKLNSAWNKLRNDVLGRGLAPPAGVPAPLAAKVGEQWEEWRNWYTEAVQSLSNAAAVHWGTEFSRWLDDWTQRYSDLRNEALAALGSKVKAPAVVPVAKTDLTEMLMWGGAGGFALALFWIWLRRPRKEKQRADFENRTASGANENTG